MKLRSKSGVGLLKRRCYDIFELRACLHGGGRPQVGEVTHLDGLTRLSTQFPILIWSRLPDRWGYHMRHGWVGFPTYTGYLTRPGVPQLHVNRT